MANLQAVGGVEGVRDNIFSDNFQKAKLVVKKTLSSEKEHFSEDGGEKRHC